MKVLIISTTVYSLPPTGYSGTEMLCYQLAEGLHKKGHQVSVVAPQGSVFSEGVELIPTAVREDEQAAWLRYRGRLEANEWEVVVDATFLRWALMSSAGRDPELPIVHWHHTSPTTYQTQPPLRYPMWVGLSKSHADELCRAWGTPAKYIYNAVDLEFYKANGSPRGGRYLAIGRYTPEKGFLDAIVAAKRLKIGLDLFGDTEIVGSPEYVKRCWQEADGYFVRAFPGVTRNLTVEKYSTYKGLIHFHRWDEPFSLVLAESMACGCPPVVSRRGAASEVVKDGVTGILVDDFDHLLKVLKGNQVQEIKPESMRKWVEDKFSIPRFVNDWEDLLLRVVSGERW